MTSDVLEIILTYLFSENASHLKATEIQSNNSVYNDIMTGIRTDDDLHEPLRSTEYGVLRLYCFRNVHCSWSRQKIPLKKNHENLHVFINQENYYLKKKFLENF